METLSRSDSRRLYSWWWDSHNSPKNSKWLQDNITDMDVKVKSMIKLIEEDADSFARRAEMYYKKRPELMKLVEEFYRAYRALAERYNHATGELRHAHRTIAKAFPDQVPPELIEDSPSKPLSQENGPHTPEIKRPTRVLFDTDDDEGDSNERPRKTGLTQLHNEAQRLKKALADMEVEKEEVLIKYQKCLEKLSYIEQELEIAKEDSMTLTEKASRAEIEVQTLKEALACLNAEKNSGLEKISKLEAMLSRAEEEMKNRTRNMTDEISRLEFEKEKMLLQYKECLVKISVLENVISVMEKEAGLLKIQAEESANEISELKKSLADLNKEKEKSALQYKRCLETISKLEKDVLNAKEDAKSSEEKRAHLEMSNLSLRAEANNLAKKIAVKDQELSEKQEELENFQRNLQDEHLRCKKIEATLENLQNVHSRSQDDQRGLAVELQHAHRMINDLEVGKNGLEEEIKQVREENQTSMENMQNEIASLREIKERLEKEVLRHVGFSDSLQQEILHLKEEIERLNGSYQSLVNQVEQAGLNPKCFGPSIRSLHDENSKMKQKCEEESNEKLVLLKKVESMEQFLAEKVLAENSFSDLTAELESSREKTKGLQEEKGGLVAEKASLLSQLKVITENMHNLLGKNAVLEKCLSDAKVELEGLREKSKGLEEICEMLKDERSYLLKEKSSLVSKLEYVERKLESLERKLIGLEEKYVCLEKEKRGVDCKVEELKVSLSVEKQERKISEIQNESTLAGLENLINLLKEENRWKKKEYEEELDKAIKAQFEMSILQKFMKDLEEKNYSLIVECQKHVEASKLAGKVISELENESLEQQVEAEVLLDEIERLRLGIYQVFRAVEPDCDPLDKIENEGAFVNRIVESIEDMKSSISRNENDKQMLLVENSVLLTLVEEMESKGVEIESKKRNLESDLGLLREEKSTNEKILRSKLEEKNNEIELFESAATKFYFDLQISSIHEVLYKNKLQEVTAVCRILENENASKTSEIEQMKAKICLLESEIKTSEMEQMKREICVMESEIKGLKSQLHAYAPVVAGLRDDIASLEHNAVLQVKLKAAQNRSQELELLEASSDPRTSTSEILEEDQSLISLQNLQARIKSVRKMMEEANKPVPRRKPNSKSARPQSIVGENIDQSKPRRFLGRENNKKKAHANDETPKLQKIRTKATEVWNGMRMKDIPLDQVSNRKKGDDQMLELWEIGEDGQRIQTIGESLKMSCKMTDKDIVYDDFINMKPNSSPPSTASDMEKELGVDMLEVSARISEANKEVNKRRVLERLTSDAQKLENLQTTVEILKTNLETNKKGFKGKHVDFETVEEQLVEAEETVVHLVDMNGQLVKKLQECPSSPEGRISPRRRKVVEQARKGSERIGRLQLELQKLQFIVMKMEDEKKNKGRTKFFKGKSVVVLRDFIYYGKLNNSVKRKKDPLCGCFRASASRNGRN